MNKNDLDFNDDEASEGGFLKRNWLALLVGAVVLTGGAKAAIALSSKGTGPVKKSDNVSMVMLTPPPPVVLPPPPPPQQMEEEMQEVEEEKPEEAPAEDTGPSTSVVSNGPADAYGLKAKGGGQRRISLGPKSTAATWTPYARSAAGRIADAMRRHERLKNSTMSIKALVWIDSTGRITRATAQSTGDAGLDAVLRDEILSGMQLSGPPPEGMKMPVNLKLSARRPG